MSDDGAPMDLGWFSAEDPECSLDPFLAALAKAADLCLKPYRHALRFSGEALIREAVAAQIPVIVDATHSRRPWRLAITQALELPAPVEWIGWWLYTDLPTSLAWNAKRERPVPVPVIQEMAAALADPHFGPSRAEGFAAICAVVTLVN